MAGKKGLEAFIKKNQKKEKKPVVTNQETTAAASSGDTVAHDVEVGQAQAKPDKNSEAHQTKQGEDSSDEEEEENQVLRVGNIKEKKDVVNKNKTGEDKKGYGLDDGMAGGDPAGNPITRGADKSKISGAFSTARQATTATGEGIQFKGKPQFGRVKKNLKFGDSFQAGLDDIEDERAVVKQEATRATGGSGADGHREFINLSSGARSGMTGASEEQKEARPAAVKPTFKGKLNLTKTGGGGTNDEGNEGVVKSYDFGVTYKSATTGEPREPRVEGNAMEPRKDRRHVGQAAKARRFGAEDNYEEDEGFEIVRNIKEKKKMRSNSEESSSEEEPRGFNSRMRGGARVEQRATRGVGAPRVGGFTNAGFANAGFSNNKTTRGGAGMFSDEPGL